MELVGNKVDLEAKRKVGTQEALEYAERNGILFLETSAKTAQNIGELFYELGRRGWWWGEGAGEEDEDRKRRAVVARWCCREVGGWCRRSCFSTRSGHRESRVGSTPLPPLPQEIRTPSN